MNCVTSSVSKLSLTNHNQFLISGKSGYLQINTIDFPIYFNPFKPPKSETTAHCAHSTHPEVIVKAATSNVPRAIKCFNVYRLVQNFRCTHKYAVPNYIPNFRQIGICRFCGRARGRCWETFSRDDFQNNCRSLVANS